MLLGYRLNDAIETTQFATASSVVDGYVFRVHSFQALGLRRDSMLVSCYDMLGSEATTDFDGMLGLDFLKNTDLLISFRRKVLGLDW